MPQAPANATSAVTGLTAVVLAGGAGRRYRAEQPGADKLAARLGGRPVIDHVLESMRTLGGDVLVIGGPRRRGGTRWLPDAHPAAPSAGDQRPLGPLAGIVAGLEAATTDLVAVVAADLPFASAEVLRRLASVWRETSTDPTAAVVPLVDGHLQPLHAVYATAFAPAVRACFDAGDRSPTSVLRRLGARVVDDLPADAPWVQDVDTADDLRRLAAG